MFLDSVTNKLYVAYGGNTNMGRRRTTSPDYPSSHSPLRCS